MLLLPILLASFSAIASLAAGTQQTYLPIAMRDSRSTDWWRPSPGTSWQIQFTGVLDLSLDVQMYDLDLFDTPHESIEALHAAGQRVVCYFSAGSWEDWRPDAGVFPESLLGNDLEGWPGERWLDIRQLDTLSPIMAKRLDLAAQKGC